MSSAARIEVFDCSPENAVRSVPIMELLFPNSTITVADLIRQRVSLEVDRFIDTLTVQKNALVALTDEELQLNQKSERKPSDGLKERQCVKALRAFESNQFFVIVGDQQVTDLDEPIVVSDLLQVEFFRLRPLVGG